MNLSRVLNEEEGSARDSGVSSPEGPIPAKKSETIGLPWEKIGLNSV